MKKCHPLYSRNKFISTFLLIQLLYIYILFSAILFIYHSFIYCAFWESLQAAILTFGGSELFARETNNRRINFP